MKKLLALIMALCMVLALCACGESDTKTNDTDTQVQSSQSDNTSSNESKESAAAFEVTVVDQNGNTVEGVMMQVCKETCIPARTDADGIAKFSVEITDGYKLAVLSCPDGYEYTGEAEIYLEDGATEYTVEITAKEEA